MPTTQGFVIAIDGPVASGKGTIASLLARELKGFHLYTGAMYRSVALLCIEKGLDLESKEEVVSVLSDLHLTFSKGKIFLNDKDITDRIKKPDTASGASVVGVYEKVRSVASKKQQEVAKQMTAKGQIVVAEGRDMGTTVFPDASFKIYLTARAEVRARRRMEQYAKEERDVTRELDELKKRDKRDTERLVSPLPTDPENLGYFVLDNSDMNEQQTLDVIKEELRRKKLLA